MFLSVLAETIAQNDLENKLKDFLNKNNEFDLPDDSISKPTENNIFSKIPISCWTFETDCHLNCEGFTFSTECLKKVSKMFKEEYQYCCYMLDGGKNHNI